MYRQPEAEKAGRAAEDSIDELRAVLASLKVSLDRSLANDTFQPELILCSSVGTIDHVLDELACQHDILLAVISAHSPYNFNNYLKKNHTWAIIEKAGIPVLVVPYQVRFKPYCKIAFASAANAREIPVLRSLIHLAECSGASVLITHVAAVAPGHLQQLPAFEEFAVQLNDTRLNYQLINDGNVARGLRNITADHTVDVLALVHRHRGRLKQLFDGGVARKLLKRPCKPLLIFPAASEK